MNFTQCPRCRTNVRVERSIRPVRCPIKGDPIVDLWFRCGACGLRIDASGTGDAGADEDLKRKLQDPEQSRLIKTSGALHSRR
jgi:hypothetical protein